MSPGAPEVSAWDLVARHVADPLLADMLLCPIPSTAARAEDDMDFWQFALLFQAIFLEGLARPFDGIRTDPRASLADKYRQAGASGG